MLKTRRGRIQFWLVTLVLVLGGLIQIGVYANQTHQYRRNSEQAQWVVNRIFPRTSHGVTISQVTIKFENGQAEVTANISGTKFLKPYSLTAKAVGVPDLEHAHGGEFYFKPVPGHKVDVSNPEFDGKSITEIIQSGAQHLGNHEKLKTALMHAAPRVEHWMVESARTGATLAMNEIPYRLKDDGVGWYLRASLKDVRIDGNELVGDFTFVTFAGQMILGAGAIVLAVLMGIGFLFFIG